MQINYKAQFTDKAKAKRRKSSKKAKRTEPSERFDVEGTWEGATAADDAHNDHQAGDADDAASQESQPEERRCGRWVQSNGRKVWLY